MYCCRGEYGRGTALCTKLSTICKAHGDLLRHVSMWGGGFGSHGFYILHPPPPPTTISHLRASEEDYVWYKALSRPARLPSCAAESTRGSAILTPQAGPSATQDVKGQWGASIAHCLVRVSRGQIQQCTRGHVVIAQHQHAGIL